MLTRQHALVDQTTGTRRTLTSLHFGTPGEGPKALIQAALHADELPGVLVTHHLRPRLACLEAEGRLRGEVVLVPMANPIGLAQWLQGSPFGRFHQGSGENFNRHYARLADAVSAAVADELGDDPQANVAHVRRALCDAVGALPVHDELQHLRRTLLSLAVDADIVLDLHCDDESVMHLYAGTPLWPQVEPLARLLGARVTLLAEESGDEPFDEACAQVWWQLAQRHAQPIPPACMAVTVELRGEAEVSHALAGRDAQALLDFLALRGLIAADAAPSLPPLAGDARPLAGCMPIVAPVPGLLVFPHPPGTTLRKGDVVAELIDPLSAAVSPLCSPVDGLLFAHVRRRYAHAGMRVAKVAGLESRRGGKLLSA